MNTKIYKMLHFYRLLLPSSIENAVFIESTKKFKVFQKHIIEYEANKENQNSLFLSVILRTQGLRIEMLEELLLCLSSQTNHNFELLIVVHKASQENFDKVCESVSNLPQWLLQKTRVFKCDEGNRTAPINFAFTKAIGEYASIIDDDDIVFDNWIDNFYKIRINNYGKVLHQYVLQQNWHIVDQGENKALRTLKEPSIKFCCDFKINSELISNECPLMSMAFPLYFYRNLDMEFDEYLSTYEDWDYILSLSFISGVCDCKNPGAVYRQFDNAENSLTNHSKEEWNKNYFYILNKIKHSPILYQFKEKPAAIYPKKINAVLSNGKVLTEKDFVRKISNESTFFECNKKPSRNKIKHIYFSLNADPCFLNNLKFEIFNDAGNLIEEDKYYINADGTQNSNGNIDFFRGFPSFTLVFKKSVVINKITLSFNLHKLYFNKDYHIKFRKISLTGVIRRKTIKILRKLSSKWH